ALWEIFSRLQQRLQEGALFTPAMIFAAATEELRKNGDSPFDHAVVDEAQDVNVQQLRFLAALAGDRPDGLFFAGDLGQRILQTPFSWKSLGVDVRGRSSTLRINYRTSHQIRSQADRLLDAEIADVDGNVESRRNAVSVFNGPEPEVRLFPTEADEIAAIGQWIRDRITDGMAAEEIGVFVRSSGQVTRAREAIRAAGLEPTAPAPGVDPEPGKVVLLPMHLAKGLEFRAVVVAACDDEVLPLQSRIEEVTDDADLEEVYNTERHLLYVACTRARDRLLVTAVKPGSEFLGDLATVTPERSKSHRIA
ncbi:MAG: 3'-5' exonuclease, partial [Gemmatimonadales bacterium]